MRNIGPEDGWTIRQAEARDLPALAEMVSALSAQHRDTATATPEALGRDLFAPGADAWLVAIVAERIHDGKLIGYAVVYPSYKTERAEMVAQLNHLYVAPEERGQGIGAALMCVVCERARTWGCTKISLYASVRNAKAQRFYKSQGARAENSGPMIRRLLFTLPLLASVAGWFGFSKCLQIDLSEIPRKEMS